VSDLSHAPIPEEDLRAVIEQLNEPVADVVELVPQGTVRTFHVGKAILRVDADPDGDALPAERLALDALATGAVTPLAPKVIAGGRAEMGGLTRPWLAYPFVDGRVLSAADVAERAEDIGRLMAHLHAARVFDLRQRFPRRGTMTLMESFKRVSDRLRAWSLGREADGLGQDELTLALSDLQRALRTYAIGLDHLFLPARRRALCHGRPEPRNIVATDAGLQLVSLGAAHLGDPAEDLAALSLAANLDKVAEDDLLHGYLDGLDAEGRSDVRFIPRFFARRTLGLLGRAVGRLDRLRRLKSGEIKVLGDVVVVLEGELAETYELLARALVGLRAATGARGDVSARDIAEMGRLVAYEELILRDRTFHIAVTGLPYAGKTHVGSALARRLGHAYVNTGALGRALALFEDTLEEKVEPHTLPRRMMSAGFEMLPARETPYYRVDLGGREVTFEIHGGDHRARGIELLADPAVRRALRDELTRRAAGGGLIVEGHYAADMLVGHPRRFHLACDDSVRRARLKNHRGVESDDEATAMLAKLDDETPVPDDVNHIDLGTRPAAAGALEILRHLLPPGRRPAPLAEEDEPGLHR
jgi:cytidylate kinase/aminoglycoside phosphotransferase (APT) family kinase protein